MARPKPSERKATARSSRQLTRFRHVINADKVFGTYNWVVVWAVRFEPVSARNSLLTRKFKGKFAISGLRETIAEALNRCAAVTFQAFPYSS